MANGLSEQQERALEITERVCSVISLIGCAWIFITFLWSSKFRKPINRLIFYAALGNLMCNIATLISQDGIRAGANTALCQFQGFLIQMFLPADAMWNLAMALNVYLTVFRKYTPAQLRKLEPLYLAVNYGITFIPALAYVFISTPARGRVYGPALTWCSISIGWNFLRIALCYGPAWVSILATFSIYVMAGREIFQKRQQLRAFNKPGGSEVSIIENPFTSYKTTEVHITSEPNPRQQAHLSASLGQGYDAERDLLDVTYVPYSITIERGLKRPSSPVTQSLQRRQHNVALEANTAAWGYLKCAMLFFISLLITWVPSSANRVYSLVHPTEVSFTANYAGGLVLPLMGFWNAVIYTTTSWRAVQSLFSDFKQSRALPSLRGRSISTGVEMGRPRSLSSGAREVLRPPASRSSFTDSMKRFAD